MSTKEYMKSQIKKKYEMIPFIGGFTKTSKDDHISAIWEIIYMILISTLPVSVAFLALKIAGHGTDFFPLIQNGELYVYSATTLAPVFYLIAKDRDKAQRFPSIHWYIISTGLIVLLSTIVVTLQRLGLLDPESIWINGSIYLFSFTVFILYTVFVYNNMFLHKPTGIISDQENNFVNEVKSHRQ